MPCYDALAPREQTMLDRQAMLCGIVTVLADQHMLTTVLNSVNWSEAGVRRSDFEAWWEDHQRADAARKRREADERARAAALRSARGKLTDEEYAALVGR